MTPYRGVTRKDSLSEAVRLEIKRLMLHHGDMQQKELALRSGESKQKIQRFVSGQTPYPPLEFLNKLLGVFGVTLLDALKGHIKPVQQLPILRDDVQRLADTCAQLDAAGVAAVQHLASTLQGASRLAGTTPASPLVPSENTPHTTGKRRTLKR